MIHTVLYRTACSLLLSLLSCSAFCGDIDWTPRAPMPVPKYEFGAAVLGGKIYTIGGYSGSTLARVDVYDPATNSWSRVADMPTARREPIVGVANGKIYAIGGHSYTWRGSVTRYGVTEEYDPATDKWTRKADLPIVDSSVRSYGNYHVGGTSVDGRIHVPVYHNGMSELTAMLEYNPQTDTWARKSSGTPIMYSRFATAELDSKLFVLEALSWNTSGLGMIFAEYRPAHDLWILLPRAPTHRDGVGLVAANGKLFAIGGTVRQGTTVAAVATVETFDPANNSWSSMTAMPTPRHSAQYATVDGTIYALGGADAGDVPLAVVEAGQAHPDSEARSFSIYPPSGILTTTTGFDITVVMNPTNLFVTNATAKLDGRDVTRFFASCSVSGNTPGGSETFRCPGITGRTLGSPGLHTVSLTFQFNDNSTVTRQVEWTVVESVE